jgi:translocation and assembly module TamB
MAEWRDASILRAPLESNPTAPEDTPEPHPTKAETERRDTGIPRRIVQRRFDPRPLAGFPVAFLLLLIWLSATQSGLRTLLDLVAEFAPDTLQIGQVEGRLLGRIAVTDVLIRLPAFEARIGRVDLDWTPRDIVGGTLSIAEIHAREIDLVPVDVQRDTEAPLIPLNLDLPLRLAVGLVRIDSLRVFSADQESPRFALERAELSGDLDRGVLTIDRIALALIDQVFELDGNGRVQATDAYPIDMDLNWESRPTPTAHVLGHTRLEGDLARLDVQSTLTGSANLDLDLRIGNVLGRPDWEGVLRIFDLDLPAFDANLRKVAVAGAFAMHGDSASIAATGTLDAEPSDFPALGRFGASLDLLWKDRILLVRSLDLSQRDTPMRLALTGRIDLDPVGADDSAPTPTGNTTLDTRGSKDSQPTMEPAWDLGFKGTALNPAELVAAFVVDEDAKLWTGLLDIEVTSRGRIAESGPELTATLEALTGELRGFPVKAAGGFTLAEGVLAVDAFRLQSGPTVLNIDGVLEQALALRFAFDSPDLASLYPGLSGRVRAEGSLSGAMDQPRVRVDLTGGDVSLAGRGVASLSAVADMDLAPGGRFELRLDGRELLVGARRWQSLSLRGEGSRANHRLALSLAGEQLSVQLDLAGDLAETGAYRGRLLALGLDSRDFETWSLLQPSPIELVWPAIEAGPLCLRHGRGSGGCLELSRAASGDWTFGVDVDRLDLDLLAPLLPGNPTIEGQAAVEGRFVAAGPVLTGRGSATLSRGRVASTQVRGQVIDFSGTRLDIAAAANGVQTRLAVPLGEFGRLDAELELPEWRMADPVRVGQPIGGHVRARLDGLAHIGDLIPRVSRLRGDMNLDVVLAGTLGQPGFRGEANLAGGGFLVPLIGLDVGDVQLQASAASADRIRLSGTADVGGGRLDISGDGGFTPSGPVARIQLTGDRLGAVDTSEYFVTVSPMLDLEANAEGARVRGEVLIPEARIRPRALPEGTVRPSSDVIVKGTERPPRYPVDVAIMLRAGEAVRIDAFGLSGQLTGRLSLVQPPGRVLVGDGQLQINDGQYRIPSGLGLTNDLVAPLTITRGQLVWARTPVRNPGLLFLAQRGTGRAVANVRVIGTLADPQFTFFSSADPAMTQAEAMTFLVTGISPGGDATVGAAFAFGRFIAPGTFLEYLTGLGDEQNRFRLRRDLTDRIQLEAESGVNQSVDVFWTFERARPQDRPTDAPGAHSIDRQPRSTDGERIYTE